MSQGSVTRPVYYSRYPLQPIDFITGSFGPGYIVGNVIKYIMRYDEKGGIEDVKKAKRYCEFLINHLEGRKPSEDAEPDSSKSIELPYVETEKNSARHPYFVKKASLRYGTQAW